MIITGPNTGGKTVTLKLVGLFAAMNQSGLFLPAQEGTTLPLFDDIFADIGDEQSIEQSLSTFSSHMKNNIYILRRATAGSLVLLDELGAGTDPEEGTALALAILTELGERGVKLLATTHYSEIKAYATTAPGFINASMEFDAQSLQPTYRVIMGVAGSSNAFLISKRLGLKPHVIERAQSFMRDERLQFDALLREAEQTRTKAQKELEKAYAMQAHAKEVDERAKKLEKQLEERRKTALEKARQEALDLIREASDEAEEIISEVKKTRRMSEADTTRTVDKARKKLAARKENLQKQLEKKEKPVGAPIEPGDLHLGDAVRILSLGADATVLTLPDGKGMVGVQAGIMKMNVHYTDLQLRQEKKLPRSTGRVMRTQKSVPLSINVNGKTVDEAIVEVDQYLDDAFLAGLKEVSIVHGKGTGALRAGVQNYLRRHPHVDSFRLGKYGEGETGVTVVTLK
ncbi:MAG: Smr/MutS family protein, partial [Christensenellaceae bacterium]|nr:Smr/MutS family protein [Christensenellaceae bacterium]